MRSITVTTVLLLMMSLSSSVFASEAEPQNSTDAVQQDEEDDEPADPIREGWAEVFSPVESYTWEFDLGAGRMMWRNAYGDYRGEPVFHLRTRYLLAGPMTLSLAADHTHRTNETTPLRFTNRRIGLAAGVGIHHWMNRWVVGADLQLGGYYDRRTLRDATGTTADGQLQPMGELTARLGLSLFSTASANLEAGARAYPHGIEPLFGLSFSWFL